VVWDIGSFDEFRVDRHSVRIDGRSDRNWVNLGFSGCCLKNSTDTPWDSADAPVGTRCSWVL
jgi:hypothetical protein